MSTTLPANLPASSLRWLALGAVGGMLIAAAVAPSLGSRTAIAADSPAAIEHTISVSGIGRVTLAPDVADISLGVNLTRPTATAARDAAAEAMTKVVDAIKKGGVADKDIQTSTLSLQPVYDYSNNGQSKLIGFQVTNIVSVTVHKLDTVGDLVDASVAAGATSVNGVTFRVDNPTAAESQARIAAVKDARSKADALAGAAGVSIIGVSQISESSSGIPYPIAYAVAAPSKDASTPVQPGQTDIYVTVSITYRIG